MTKEQDFNKISTWRICLDVQSSGQFKARGCIQWALPHQKKDYENSPFNFLKKWSIPSAEVLTTSVIQDKCLIGSSYCDFLGHTVGGGKI